MSAKTPESITLDHSIEIYIPTQCRCGQMLPEDVRAEVLDEVKGAMHGWFGGVSKKDDIRVEELEGAWPLKNGEIANERVDVVYSNASAEALEEHFEELPALAASIANRLTQESIAFRVDKKMTLMPGQDTQPHRCAGGVSPGSLPVARQPNEKERMRAIQASLQRISSVRDARDLFCNVLHYEFEDEQIHTVQWPDNLKECLAPRTSPQIIADQNGFKILYLQLAENYLRKGHERQVVQRIIKDDPTLRGLVVVSDIDQKEWHLVNAKFEKEDGKKERLRLRRMRVGPEQSVRTAVERLKDVDVERLDEGITAAQLQDIHDKAFDVESVSKDFFNEISNWYFWALSEVEFPDDTVKDGDDEKHRATSLIRFLTRIIFCWFLKEKNLIPDSLFKEKDLAGILKDLDPDSCSYHQGILQNLFFATLNQRMGKDSKGQSYRAFAGGDDDEVNLYRYEEHFQDSDKALSYFVDIPFLNGGLFECLDYTDENSSNKRYVDGFTLKKQKRARIPNQLFFRDWHPENLSEAYGDPTRRNVEVRGLLNILQAYNFTVEENTPIDEEIALDPELLGKVFENLLASYNEETKTTARKQTGSFYTPRPIVEYMVDESLKAHLISALTTLGRKEEEAREQLDLLLGYTEEEPSFYEEEISALLESIHTCKILDPACGSGAFPIGMLQKLVHVVHKLDPENARWKQLQISQATKISDSSARDAAIKAIERDFEENGDDYGRKLYLIENCLYGVDIQPIAIQISKLRFFISLICDQQTNRDKSKNHGIRALPNLETKFVAANTLVGLPEMDQMALVDPRVNQIEAEIESLYHRHFSIQRRDQKLAIQKKLGGFRHELGQVLAESLGSSQKAERLAEWDPFNSQVSADFFDPQWMFGRSLSDGFDLVIGNPPYLGNKEIGAKKQESYLRVFGFKDDMYSYFFLRGFELLCEGGVLSYITSNTFLSLVTKLFLRKELLQRRILEIADVGEVFEAAIVNTAISLVRKSIDPNDYSVRVYKGSPASADTVKFSTSIGIYRNTLNNVFFEASPLNLRLYEQYNSVMVDLKDRHWANVETAKRREKNRTSIQLHIQNLNEGDISLLGIICEGAQGLVTGNNSKYIARVCDSIEEESQVFGDFVEKLVEKSGRKPEEFTVRDRDSAYNLAEDLKTEASKPALFGKFFLYKTTLKSELVDFELLTETEKKEGSDRDIFLPYQRGNEKGYRWSITVVESILWSKKHVEELRGGVVTNSRWQGEAYFGTSGFGWVDYFTDRVKAFVVPASPYSKNVVKFHSQHSISDEYMAAVLNSKFICYYIKNFITSTHTLQVNDGKLIPIVIPSESHHEKVVAIVGEILKKTAGNPGADVSAEEGMIDGMIFDVYGVSETDRKNITSLIK